MSLLVNIFLDIWQAIILLAGDSLREMTQGKPLFSPEKSHETRVIPAEKEILENLMDS